MSLSLTLTATTPFSLALFTAGKSFKTLSPSSAYIFDPRRRVPNVSWIRNISNEMSMKKNVNFKLCLTYYNDTNTFDWKGEFTQSVDLAIWKIKKVFSVNKWLFYAAYSALVWTLLKGFNLNYFYRLGGFHLAESRNRYSWFHSSYFIG